jgi:cell division protein FtsN
MAAGKRKQATRTGNGGNPWPFWVPFALGILLGLGVAVIALYKGWAPALRKANVPQPNPEATAPKASEPAVADDTKKPAAAKKTYDFYSVLPEMEVVIPDAELSAKARAEQQRQQGAAATTTPNATATTPATPATPAAGARYVLQAGSYPEAKAAEEVKAKLALLGFVARVQPVTVNGKTWHRVRVGPYGSASDVESAKQSLTENGVNAIALKDSGTE